MILKYLLPLVAIAGVVFAVYTVAAQSKPQPPAAPVAQPAASPYDSQVPGAGLVEPSTEFISIAPSVSGVVMKVFVKAGDQVKAGAPLFMVDDRSLTADLAARHAAVEVAKATLQKLKSMPRAEEVKPAEARVRELEGALADLSAQLNMWESADARAVSAEEMSRKRFSVRIAESRLSEARGDLELLQAGAWKPDIDVAEANLSATRAEMQRVQTEIDRLTVRAPVDTQILKVNIRPGEFAQTGGMGGGGGNSGDAPLMTIGATDVLHIRVDIDENDAWRVREGAEGFAYIRGNSKLKTPIKFVRFEPYVIPKRSLTGASGERVDTRVLQVICSFKRSDLNAPVYVGQQMDVFLSAPPLEGAKFGADPDQAAKDLKGKQ